MTGTASEGDAAGQGSAFHFSPNPNRAHEINWLEWSEEAFRRAQQEDKPIILDITAVWCHWCHVMDETSYSDQTNIELINNRFVAIRVDNDRRPDINERYNMGGWPTTALLSPEGEILAGATYLPPEQLHQSMIAVLHYYQTKKAEIKARVAELEMARKGRAALPEVERPITEAIVDNVLQSIRGEFDEQHGGFGRAPKFPYIEVLDLTLFRFWRTKDLTYRTILTRTLNRMSQGGLFDQVEGGFFRYSTTQDWTIPHFEKMLEDNANLFRLYLQAFQVLGKTKYRDAALRTFDYLRAALYDAERGVFFGSQDADEHYYSLPMDERAKIRPPYVDKTIYTNWNATMVSAALEAARILGDPSYQDLALKALDFLWREMDDDQTGAMFHYYDGLPHLTGLLVDQVYVARAFLDAHESTGEKDYLDRARELAQFIETRLRDKVAGGFFDLPEGHERLGVLAERHKSLPQNAVAAEVFLRLYYLTGAAEYGTAAEATLRCFADDYPRFRLFAATYAMAVQRFLNFPTQITIVSGAGDKRARELLGAALGIYDPTKIVQILDPATDQERLGRLGYPPMPTPLAYVCVGRTCARPTDKPGEIGERVRQLVSPQG